MDVNIESSWKTELSDEFVKPYFQELIGFVRNEYLDKSKRCYPPARQIFAAFDRCPFDKVRVVIIGQDPYHGYGQANGLCFSVADSVRTPPSLVNIFEEIRRDLGKPVPNSGNLERWADQGVLLLNATLTVSEGAPGSHQKKGWETFTDAVIAHISRDKEHVVFLLWGNYAQQKGKNIDKSKHLVLASGHPSPMSANQGKWFGNRHFSQANEYLKSKNLEPVQW
ncbi:uracil-DNA glycosylase [Flavobacterium silvaticum]|uniref:Uracil-DNA glycosylase n=1 Tax=Flavobacterium silvaticum TaxID=1852020 RepID=A0A972FPI8_9FLAO|nr:uracil-DNA glycosylase [Flavobacterium silvaticum]NMH29020.1 uracil-DNA glycosylase [Flavobacterium silvaticum]